MNMNTFPSVVAAFDGNDRRYPHILTNRAKKQGFVETSLVKDGVDEVRFMHHKSCKVRVTHKASLHGFESMHKIQIVEIEYEGKSIGFIFFNSGRGTEQETLNALDLLANQANMLARTCDYVFVMVVEFGEGDKNKHFEFRTLKSLLKTEFRAFFGTHRECVFAYDKAHRDLTGSYTVIRNTSVKHQSPTRGQASAEVASLHMMIDVFHSQAGFFNGSRAAAVKRLLGLGWWRVFGSTRTKIVDFLLDTKPHR